MLGLRRILAAVVPVLFLSSAGFGAEPTARKPFSLEKRELWTTGNIHGTPEPPDPYTTQNAFPKLRLFEPLSVGLMPGSQRFGVATRPGKIFTFEIKPDVDKADLLLDIKQTTYGMAFHPQFEKNGFLYVTYVVEPDKPKGSRLSRFKVKWERPAKYTAIDKEGKSRVYLKPGQPPVADPDSEQIILEWPSGGHNGCCIRFGADGFLYLATGDGSGIADGLQTGQDITDLLGSILRIDVDRPDGSRPYSIPKDNPFVGRADARGEIWSFGHRQVWKFSFDNQQRL